MEATRIKSPPRTLMEVFRSLPEGTLVQLIENQLIMTPAPLYIHQKILNKINVDLYNVVKEKDFGEVLTAPLDVYLDQKNAYQPDIIFISHKNKDIIRKDGLHGGPDLVIELLSPSTAKYDLNEKKSVYERSGVLEYWIVNPEDNDVQGYLLNDGIYENPVVSKKIIQSRLLNHEFAF